MIWLVQELRLKGITVFSKNRSQVLEENLVSMTIPHKQRRCHLPWQIRWRLTNRLRNQLGVCRRRYCITDQSKISLSLVGSLSWHCFTIRWTSYWAAQKGTSILHYPRDQRNWQDTNGPSLHLQIWATLWSYILAQSSDECRAGKVLCGHCWSCRRTQEYSGLEPGRRSGKALTRPANGCRQLVRLLHVLSPPCWLIAECRWLLVFENVDDLKALTDLEYIPRNPVGQGGIIITTQIQYFKQMADILLDLPLESLGTRASFDLLFKTMDKNRESINEKEEDMVYEILNIVGGLPLAITTIGGHIKQTGLTLSGFLRELKESNNSRSIKSTKTWLYSSSAQWWQKSRSIEQKIFSTTPNCNSLLRIYFTIMTQMISDLRCAFAYANAPLVYNQCAPYLARLWHRSKLNSLPLSTYIILVTTNLPFPNENISG